MACKVKTKKGPCRRTSGDSEYCPYHRKVYEKHITHGRTAKPDVLGVPKKYHGAYQEFLNSPKPFELKHELALLRTLYLELRDLADAKPKTDEVCMLVSQIVQENVKGKPEQVGKLIKILEAKLRPELDTLMENQFTSPKDLMVLADILEIISKVAERMKKIQEGIKLDVQIDVNILVGFLKRVVFPVIEDPLLIDQMVQRAMAFSTSRYGKDSTDDVEEFQFPALPAKAGELLQEVVSRA